MHRWMWRRQRTAWRASYSAIHWRPWKPWRTWFAFSLLCAGWSRCSPLEQFPWRGVCHPSSPPASSPFLSFTSTARTDVHAGTVTYSLSSIFILVLVAHPSWFSCCVCLTGAPLQIYCIFQLPDDHREFRHAALDLGDSSWIDTTLLIRVYGNQ